MEEKMFELMTKMYSELTEKLSTIDRKLDSKADKNDIIILENKQENDVKILYDGYVQTFEKLVAMENKIDNLVKKVDKQDVEIRVIKGGKKARLK